MKLKNKKIGAAIFTFAILAFLALGFLLNKKLLDTPVNELYEGKIKFGEFVDDVEGAYKSGVAFKNDFVNINGLFARATGRNHYNGVSRLKNGMLIYGEIPLADMSDSAQGLIEFNSYLNKNGIKYLYVQAPVKVDLQGKLLYEGTVAYGNQNADQLLGILKENNVDCIDLRTDIAATPELVEKYFFKTDHHWTPEGAFKAFEIVLNDLYEKYPDANIDLSLTDPDKWNVTEYQNCFLGSHGKRVGIFYAGVDDFLLYTPKFDTDMSMYIPKHKLYYSGTFDEAVAIHKDYLENKDLFNENPYCVYIGGDYPIVHHRNQNASSDLKVLILKDSFSLPFQSFMATAFKEVDVIDPRHFTDCTIAEYISVSKPDIVITLLNPSVFDFSQYYKNGTSNAEYHDKQTAENVIYQKGEVTIAAKPENMYTYNVLKNGAKFNTKYKISFDDVEFLAGDSKCITVALYNSETKQFACNYAFDIDYCRKNGGFEWTFVSPEKEEGNLQILIYAGRHSQTGGNTVRFTNVTVTEYN